MLIEQLLPQIRERLVTILDDAALIEAAKLLRTDTDIVVVCDAAGVMTGIITKTDVVSRISTCLGASCVAPATSAMTRSVVMCKPGDRLREVWLTMKQHRLKNIPVIDTDTRPVGMLNVRDALEVLLQEVEDEEALLRDYVMCVGYH
jgi:CBS domain-containing protein